MRAFTATLLFPSLLACGQVDQHQQVQTLDEDAAGSECVDLCIDRRSTAPDDSYDDGESCDADAPVVFCTIVSDCPNYCVSCDDGSYECSSCE